MAHNYTTVIRRDYVDPFVVHVREQFKISKATMILDVSDWHAAIIKETIKGLKEAGFEATYIKSQNSLEVVPIPRRVTGEVIFVNFKKKKVVKKIFLTA